MTELGRLEYLRFEAIGKSFPGVRALDGISFGVAEGSVHALMGENGAGKSTLLKILSGAYHPDQGKLVMGGAELAIRGTQDALTRGIAVIYQELQLVNELSVAENLFLGHMPSLAGWIDRRTMHEVTRELLARVGEEFSPGTAVGRLPIAQRQMVEIAKALSRDAKVLAFDEPTSSLSAREVDRLFEVILALKAEGRVVLYVTHRMDEVFKICDAATVLRDGRHVVTHESLAGVTTEQLVREMVGRDVDSASGYRAREVGETALKVDGLTGPGVIQPVSFEVKKGEILGIFGLVGAGRTELLKLIAGAGRPSSGAVFLSGRQMAKRSTRRALNAGVALCPEDRKKEGIVANQSVQDNVNLGVRRRFSLGGFVIRSAKERENATDKVQRLGIRTPGLGQAIGYLSGGNQQKAVLGRVLGIDLKVLLLDEPTRGIDIGAKSEVHEIVRGLAERGVAVVIVSSEMPELLGACDRILVMSQGRLTGSVDRSQASQERLLELALPTSSME